MSETARVYDLDGTLVRLAVDWPALRGEIIGILEDAGVEAETVDVGGWKLLDIAHSHGVGDAVDDLISSHERAGARDAERLPAADDVAELPVPVGVCSLNCEAACRIALEGSGLIEHVDAVVGRDTVSERKPHPEPLLSTVTALSSRPEGTLFVGDSQSDSTCAEAAGTGFAFVDTMYPGYRTDGDR